MSGCLAILRKELRQYFGTPIAYVLIAVFWAASGYFFSFSLFLANVLEMVTTFHNMSILLLLLMPLLTMRSFAEESAVGTLELLMALPLGPAAIVFGKFLAAEFVLIVMLVGSATALVPLLFFGAPDLGPILGGYIGVLLLGSAFVGIGLSISSLCSNQIVAATLTWAVLLLLWFIDYGAKVAGGYTLTLLLRHLSVSQHYLDLIRGILPLSTIAYLLALTVLSVAVTVQGLQWRRC
jgi:ABC-2 type transport system permease protein